MIYHEQPIPATFDPPLLMSGRPQRLGSILGSVIDEMGIGRHLDEARVVEAWGEVAGPTISRMTSSVWVKGGTLFIKVSSAAWRQELHLQRMGWRDRINGHLQKDLVREIRFC